MGEKLLDVVRIQEEVITWNDLHIVGQHVQFICWCSIWTLFVTWWMSQQ